MCAVSSINYIARRAFRSQIQVGIVWTHDIWVLLRPCSLARYSDEGVGVSVDLRWRDAQKIYWKDKVNNLGGAPLL